MPASEKRRKIDLRELERNPFEEEEKKKKPGFVSFTRSLGKSFSSYGKNAVFTKEEKEAVSFLGWDLTAPELKSAYYGIIIIFLAIAFVIGSLLFLVEDSPEDLRLIIPIVIAGLGVFAAFTVKNYPKQAAEREKLQALYYVPEIVNYLTISLQLTPNLEKAVEFAAAHGQGKIAEELKKIVWDLQIGRYYSVEEALDELAYKWGAYNDDFKQALMIIRSSVLEADAARRRELLNKAVTQVLEGSREKMDDYARKLHQPAVFLYYFGILLPLLLAIILPIGGALSDLPLNKPEFIFVGYVILLPLLVFAYGKGIISSRPPTYDPPIIPENYPGLKKNSGWKFLALLAFFGIITLGFMIDQGVVQDSLNGVLKSINPNYDEFLDKIIIPGTLGQIESFQDKAEELQRIPHITFLETEYGLFVGQFTIFGFLIGLALSISIYLKAKYSARKKVQDEIRGMETEFKDALYLLASRLGENKPFEEALRSSVQFLPNSAVAQRVFKRVLENITSLGMTIDAAIFDNTYGALKDIPSRTIRSGMQFVVDSIELGVNVSSKALISLALQLRNNQKIDESLKKMLEDVTVVLNMMSLFVAPIVLGVVGAMQKLIVSSFGSISSGPDSGASLPGTTGFGGLAQALTSTSASSGIESALFALIMGIYVIEIVALLTYFNSQIEETNNDLHTYLRIANALPIAAVLFCLVVFFASSAVG
ncbi:type II secretion system F family protein [Candidatus Micrarchaeota archaeon]|nr:type II secretion system F family protein [Candidatus Micrarchaeota archaeon]